MGVCVDNNDPLKQERCKYRIAKLHDGIPDSALPWSRVQRDGDPTSTSQNIGSKKQPPPIGSTSWIHFEDESMYYSYYSGVVTQTAQQMKEFSGNDPTGQNHLQVEGGIDSAGNRWTVDRKRNTFDYEHASGLHFSVDGKGRVGIKTADNAVGSSASEKNSQGITLHITGDVNILSEGTVNVGGKTVKIVSEGDMTLGANGILTFTAQTILMPTPVPAKMPMPQIPNVDAPPARIPPILTAPTDPTAGSSSPAA